ncbi:MAG: hypothetical protein AAF710_05030 [Planctomycetota bacterium]
MQGNAEEVFPGGRFWTPLRVLLIALLLPAFGLTAVRLVPEPALTPREVASVEADLREAALRMIETDGMRRGDGAVYAVDVTQLATAAALANDAEVYEPLRRVILDELLVRRVEGDPAHGVIGWRFFPEPPENQMAVDASGTTEALRAAEALWEGVRAFGHDDDRAAIALILDAYARHAYIDGGVWMIRNYFNLHPDVYHYVTNSFLVDYDPDLVTRLAEAYGRDDWAELAANSAGVVEAARTGSGLLHQVIRPEVATIMPGFAPGGFYSIDGVEQLSNVLTVAERSVTTNPEAAAEALAFARERVGDLRLYYDVRTGVIVPAPGRPEARPGVETWGPLLRLAVRLDDRDTAVAALRQVVNQTRWMLRDEAERDPPAYLLGEAWLALRYAARASLLDPPADPTSTEEAAP